MPTFPSPWSWYAAGTGSPSLANIPLTEVNLTDGSWTLLDPDGLVKSVTYAGGFHTITWNALAAGSSDYTWTHGGSNHRAPRWHKVLNVSGTDIQAGDFLLFTSRIEPDLTVNAFNQKVVFGVADDPTSTAVSNIDGTGGFYARLGSNIPTFGTWQLSLGASNGNAANRIGVCTISRGGDSLGSGVFLNIGAGTNITDGGTRNSHQNAQTYVGNVSVMVGVGIRSPTDTVPQDAQQRFKVSFGAITYGGMT